MNTGKVYGRTPPHCVRWVLLVLHEEARRYRVLEDLENAIYSWALLDFGGVKTRKTIFSAWGFSRFLRWVAGAAPWGVAIPGEGGREIRSFTVRSEAVHGAQGVLDTGQKCPPRRARGRPYHLPQVYRPPLLAHFCETSVRCAT